MTSADPILLMPPFPGARAAVLAHARGAAGTGASTEQARACLDALVAARVGGAFWQARPELDSARRLIACPADRAQADVMRAAARAEGVGDTIMIAADCDPWHLIDHAEMLWCDADDAIALLARAAGRRVRCFGNGRFAALTDAPREAVLAAAAEWLVDRAHYVDPFSDAPCDALRAIELLGFWRGLIDANRDIAAAAGLARWKRATVEPLLWGGTPLLHVAPAMAALPPLGAIAVWKARVPAAFLGQIEASGRTIVEVEDGFIRSAGLGADCVPPLSITVDRHGAHFDPAQPSELETLLQHGEIDPDMLARADRLRDAIVASGISKYGSGAGAIERPAPGRRHVLVTGQVEDDRSVLAGGGGVAGNLDLLRRVRACEPDAFILYKPHPDVEAGHRKGHVPRADALAFADAIVTDAPIAALLAMVDHVHVLTSLAGFEALIRGTPVTTHGVPFFAGWGLTTDLGPVPARRTRVRTMGELLAAVLLLYPRYLDPVTGLPCPPEILVDRLAGGARPDMGAVVMLRRLQGVVRRRFARMLAA